jgi:sporulation protein YlmC with PRC-barrel domain
MIAAELRGGNKPSLNEALGWIGSRVDDVYGAAVGRLEDVWIDPGTGAPRWLLVKEGRFGGRSTLIPFGDATAGAGHVWVPYEREVVRQAPAVEPGVPLTQQVEATLRNHYAASAAASSLGDPGPGSGQTRATVHPEAAESRPSPDDSSHFPPPPLPQRPPPPVQPPPQQPQQPYEVPPPHQPLQYAPPRPVAPPPPAQPRYEEQSPPHRQPQYEEQAPPPPAYHQPQPTFEPTPPQTAYEPTPPAPMPDPAAVLAAIPAGSQIEIELEGNITIAGNVRSIRITLAERRS